MLGGEQKVTADVRRNLFHHTCLKAILYISKTTVLSEALKAKLLTTFHEIPLAIVRANTLPKNAPVELEMMAMATKSNHACEVTPTGLTLKESSGLTAYQFMRFDSIESYLDCDKLVGAGRVDVYLEAHEKLDEAAKAAIQAKCPGAVVSESYVLEILSKNGQGGPLIAVEFISMTD